MGYAEIEEISEDETLLKEEVHRFAEEVIRPASIEIDRMPLNEYPEKVVKKDSPYWRVLKEWKKLGYHRGPVPEMFGGEGLPARMVHILVEEVAWGSSGFSIAFGVDLFPILFTAPTFDEYLNETFVKPWLEDDRAKYHGCWGVTEPEHGSDWLLGCDFVLEDDRPERERITPGQVTAKKDGDEWIINGAKSSWISSAPVATHVALHVNLDLAKRSVGGGCVVPLDSPGVTKGKPIAKYGQKDCPQGELAFEDVRIPGVYMTLEPEALHPSTGLMSMDQILCVTSSWMAASSTGLARAAFEEALKYSKERIQGGRPICEHQLVRKKLFEMFVKVETARAYSRRIMEHVWRELFEKFTFKASYRHALAAQVYCKRIAYEVADDALQIFGGYGITDDFLIQKLYRDARVKLIEDGTVEVLSLEGAGDLIRNY